MHSKEADGKVDERVRLRFVDGRSVSPTTTQFFSWRCEKLKATGKKALLSIWDNASCWHTSHEPRSWKASHNRGVKKSGKGARIVPCVLPKKSP